MIDPGIAKFLACYVDTLQIIPSEMQTAITAYLQSDLQHQHLLRLCKESITELTSTTAADDQKKALRKLVYSLIAIQDICDRRITTIDELQELLENHTQTLLACQNDLTSNASCLGTSSVDNVSEIEAYENQDDETRGAVNLALLRQASDDGSQRLEVDGAGSVSHTDAKLKGKTRLSVRPGTRVSRSTNSRRPLNRWDNGTHRRKARPSPVGVNKGALLALKHRRAADARLTERLGADQRERKLNMSYPRYARTQQRLKNQQRILSRALHPGHSRLLQYPNSSQRSTQAKGRDGRMLLPADDRVGSKGTRLLASGQRMDSHVEWIHSERYYPEHSADSHGRSLSNNSSEEDRRESDDNGARSPEISPRITDTGARNWIKEEPAISEDMEDSDSVEDIMVDESSATTQDTKPYIGLEQRQRLSSPSIHSRVSHTGSRRLSRLRKTTDDSSKSEHAVCRSVSPLDHNLTAFSSSGNNGNTINRRRDRTMTPVRFKQDTRQNPRQSPENSTKHASPSDLSIGGGGKHRNPAGSHSPAERPVNVNGSPDERLYCLCKKVSFGDMIACDNKSCKVEWFHFGCVDIRTQPKGKWYCPNCRGESSKIKRADL